MPVFTAAAAYIAASIGVTSVLGIAAINLGLRVLATYVITSLITRKSDNPNGQNGASSPTGNRVQLPPATNNKLPVVYGNAFMSPVIIDAKISTDQQYMWYVMALSEVTDSGTIGFDDPDNVGYPLVYWGDKQVKFNSTYRYQVDALIDPNTLAEDTKVAGNMNIYFYNDGSMANLYGAPSAISVMSDDTTGGGIPYDYRWSTVGDKDMTSTAFMILRLKYNQDANLTGLQQVTTLVQNTLKEPGSIIIDYLTNTRYGCAVPLVNVDTTTLIGANGLNDYSSEEILFTYDGTPTLQARYTINGAIDTTKTCIDNLLNITDACDSWLQWDETVGKWSVVINRSIEQSLLLPEDLFTIYSDTLIEDIGVSIPTSAYYAFVIGGVDITPVDLNSTFNKVELQFPSKLIKDQTDYAYINLPEIFMNPNEPVNSLTISLPMVNDSVQAQYIGTRRLEMSRDDLVVSMTTDYSGIQVEAGDIVRVYHKDYGWTEALYPGGKLFRITQVQETKTEDGSLGARLTMNEYNDNIYGDGDINSFLPSPNTGITDPTIISTPEAPTCFNFDYSSTIPSFQVNVIAPAISVGQVTSLEFWYQLAPIDTPPSDTTGFSLYQTVYYNSGPVYPSNYDETILVSGLPASPSTFAYYFRVRASGSRSKSGFSDNSSYTEWNPSPTVTVTGQNFQTIFQPTPVTIARFSGNGAPDLSNVTFRLYGLSGASQIPYTANISNASMSNNEWRIDTANIVASGVTISSPVDGGQYALWDTNSVSAISTNKATLTVPVIYKDNAGNVYTAPPSVVNLNTLDAGPQGSRGVVTLAYVPVTYNPTTANDATLSGSFFDTTGFTPPIDNDGAVFFNETTDLVSARKYDSNASPYWQVATLQIPGQQIVNNSVNGNVIRAGTVYGNRLIANTVQGNVIIANTLVGNSITVNTLNGNRLIANTVQGNVVIANTLYGKSIIANTLNGNTVIANTLYGNTLIAGTVQANTIYGNSIIANTIDSSKIQAFTLNSGQIQAGGITASSIAANTITFENLVIGAVTQSKSTISEPEVRPLPYYNWPSAPLTWPDNTRAIIPSGGVTIIPTTDPTSSGNTEFVEGSRIEVGFSVKFWTDPTANVSGNSISKWNLVEVWKSGASNVYDRGFNTVRHSYNTGTYGASQTIHAYGYGAYDKISTDGGATWSTYTSNATSYTITGALNYYGNTSTLQTTIVAPLQFGDSHGVTGDSAAGHRTGAFSNAIKLNDNFIVNSTTYRNSFTSIEAAPGTGDNGNSDTEFIVTGLNGDILYGTSASAGFSGTGFYRESSGTLQTLNASYSNKKNVSSNGYTTIVVGDTGTILRAERTLNTAYATWSSRPTTFLANGQPITSDIYGIAGDDTAQNGSSVWVACGQYGVILVSEDDGDTWTQVSTPISQNLNSVRYMDEYWVIVGDDGTLLWTSGDPIDGFGGGNQGFPTSLNVYTVDYSRTFGTMTAGGPGVIYNIDIVPNIDWGDMQIAYQDGPAESLELTRLTYFGSYPLVTQVDPVPDPQQQILNNQVFSGIVVDTAYVAGQETTYYLVVGNMKGATAYAGQVFLQVTEVKR